MFLIVIIYVPYLFCLNSNHGSERGGKVIMLMEQRSKEGAKASPV